MKDVISGWVLTQDNFQQSAPGKIKNNRKKLMCGIAGIIDYQKRSENIETVRNMIGLLYHRGPDATGIYDNAPATLGHARLSIIDLEGGDQPIHNEDKRLWIVFNGEIFNYPELREDLVEKGHKFYTRSDTEVIIHLYEEYGPEMLERLNGQFAIAIWDKRDETLFLARDRVGIRPIFYYQEGPLMVFGSEIKALLAVPQVPRQIDTRTLNHVFTCWAAIGGGTAFHKIRQIPPGSYAIFDRKGLQIRKFWEPVFHDADPWDRSLEEWVEALQELLVDATRIRLRADVPVGAYLSGGIDSTYTTSIVKRNFNNDLRTFSVKFSDERFDETAYQAQAISSLKTAHSDILCTEKDIGAAFPMVIWHSEIPILRTAPTPLYRLSRLVRDNAFKVVLTGEGADEIFAGYNIFKEDKVRRFWAKCPESKLRPMLLEKLYPYVFSAGNEKAKSYLQSFFKKSLSELESPVFSHLVRWQNTSHLRNFMLPEVRGEASLDTFVREYIRMLPRDFMCWSPLSRAQYTEMTIFLSNYLLSSQGDRMAMANSVEGRYPFLDHRVLEFAMKLPQRLRLNGLTEKFILKQAARNSIPDTVINRPKQPYRAPISRCFFGPDAPAYVMELLSHDSIKDAGYFDPSKVERLVKKCRQKKGALLSERENMAVVGILSTQLLHAQYVKDFPYIPPKISENLKLIN